MPRSLLIKAIKTRPAISDGTREKNGTWKALNLHDIRRLRALLTLHDFELHPIAFRE